MGRSAGGMAVVAGGGKINAAQRGLAVDAVFVKLNRLAVNQFMLGGQIYIFMAAAAGFGKMEGIDAGFLVG